MHLIKPCPSCGIKLRFPVNRGKIRVRCSCGNSFTADPDDPGLYRGAAFDLRISGGGKGNPFSAIRERIGQIRFTGLWNKFITRLYDLRYRLQNFRLLPSSEQRRLLLLIILLLLLIAAAAWFLPKDKHPTGPFPAEPPPSGEDVII